MPYQIINENQLIVEESKKLNNDFYNNIKILKYMILLLLFFKMSEFLKSNI
jgi:hypothetical protein